jgi:hypothetical protein
MSDSDEENRLNNVHEDYRKIRDELYEMLGDAKDALKLAKGILESTEHPRAVETYSGLLKNVATINGQILELTKTYKDIIDRKSYRDTGVIEGNGTTNAFLFNGTTSELQEFLIDMAKRPKEIVDVTPKDE